ncbi:MAG TPA: TraR/DksA C4-type zinc finger protein [Cyclobacteriaceae bacterium]|nr:TraR/DksA C4-type zinc finger protein [Cyclobacteriaceae bacterium]
MAKKKKTPAKVAKKKTAAKSKTKTAAKAKKGKAVKAAKKASTRKATAKKAARKKPVKKAVTNQKKSVKVAKKKSVKATKAAEAPVSKTTSKTTKTVKTVSKTASKTKVKPQVKKIEPKGTQPEKVRIEAPQKEQPAATESKPLPPVAQHMFQIPNQRPIAHKPARTTTDDTRTRYSEEELREFEKLILEKLEKAREEYKILKDTLNRTNDEGTDATSGGNTKVLEDGAETAEKENLSQLAARQQKYITNLENALIRIKNGTYGICSVTGKLISKERLIAVPHTTQSIEAKMMKQD